MRRGSLIGLLVAGAVLLSTALLGGGYFIGRNHNSVRRTAPDAHTAASSAVAAPSDTASAPSLDERIVGYGAVKIGMDRNALAATNMVSSWTPTDESPGCSTYPLTWPGSRVWLQTTASVGSDGAVVGIDFGPKMLTSAGIGIGSTLADLQASYPDLDSTDASENTYVAPVASHISYYFGIGQDRKVAQIVLEWAGQVCAN